jgi:Gpi18-like mannosyltransferase
MNRFRAIAFTRRLPAPLIRDGIALLLLVAAAWLLAEWCYRAPREASFKLDVLPAVLPRAGLYELETFSDRPGIYRWTDGAARVDLPNPGGPLVARLVLAGGPGRTTPARISSGTTLLTFDARPEPRSYAFALPAVAGERVRIAIETPTFRDRSRLLGIVVSDLAIGGGGGAPQRLLLALLVATAGAYALLRRAGWSPGLAAGATLLLQILALLWQSQVGWRYGVLGALLALVGAAGLAAAAIDYWQPARDTSADPRAALTHRDASIAAGLLALALCVRLPWLAAPDPVGDLELSARRMGFLRAEGLAGAYHDDGDYMPLRLYWLRGFSALPFLGDESFSAPLPSVVLVLIKLPGVSADLATVALLYLWCRRWRAPAGAATLAALYALAPPVWMNVAWWGQVDAILMLPILLMVALLDRAGGRWSWACWALALLIKPQAIVFAPVLYIATLRRHGCRALLAGGGLATGLAALGCAPLLLAGQGEGLLQAYAGSVGRFPQLTNRAYNLWYLATLGAGGSDVGQGLGPLSLRAIGMLLMASAALLVSLALLYRANGPARTLGAAALALAFFCLPTQIHERYLFLTLAPLVMTAAADRPALIAFVVLAGSATLNILGALRGFSEPAYAAIAASSLPMLLAALNLLVLVALLARLLAHSLGLPRATAALRAEQRPEVS